ncbi:hypothetical protein OPV22_012138 [Ensete ventricosum]|uniref:Pectinesterase inhibitor domain-containing protein n=1 Tax=Ensete ventricosum TaxID=4639 RepID=A0A426YCB4_ENSVE|nr:hypothetical protein OPV22_012138 [Ensete ventricosum]RRT49369.1 hypothetical protein B296_00009615 [Ensete ventricosum]RWW35240.1 hypothetical protein BHE74_00059853 [Ensete ventricosum]
MRPSSICILLAVTVLLLHHHHLLPGVEASVEQACKDAKIGSVIINYDLCLAELLPYPGSQAADKKGLAVIAASVTKDKATSANAKAKSLLASASDPKTKECLESCKSAYEYLLSNVNSSITAIKENRVEDAKINLRAAVDAPDTCEQGCKELKVPSPLTKEDSDLTQSSNIALAFAYMLDSA